MPVLARLRRTAATGALAGLPLLSLLGPAAPADAAPLPPLAPAVQVVDPRCTFDEDTARSWTSAAGVEHVLYALEGNESFGCGGDRSGTTWHASRAPGGTWLREPAPWRGSLLAVTGDATGLYAMHADAGGVWLSRRTGPQAWQTVRHLSPLGLGTRVRPSGAVVARAGRWWAVWSENRTPDTYGTTDLWEAGTLGGPAVRSRVTDTPEAHDDLPQLALRRDGSAFLLWTRRTEADGRVVLRAGTSRGGRWAARTWEDRAPALSTDLATSGSGVVAVLWGREGRLVYADDRSGTFRPEVLPDVLLAGPPALAVTDAAVHVALTTRELRARLLTRPAGGSWTARAVTTSALGAVRDLAARGGRVTVYYGDERRLLARSAG